MVNNLLPKLVVFVSVIVAFIVIKTLFAYASRKRDDKQTGWGVALDNTGEWVAVVVIAIFATDIVGEHILVNLIKAMFVAFGSWLIS